MGADPAASFNLASNRPRIVLRGGQGLFEPSSIQLTIIET
jgi:hypothetical protein